jgi:hypothetical protein
MSDCTAWALLIKEEINEWDSLMQIYLNDLSYMYFGTVDQEKLDYFPTDEVTENLQVSEKTLPTIPSSLSFPT